MEPPAVPHVLTIDLEDWYHGLERAPHERVPQRVEEPTRRLLELLARHRARATFFAVGEVARAMPRLLRSIAAAGHFLGTHGMSHRRVGVLGPTAFRRDLRDSIAAIEDAAGVAVRSHRAPHFSIDQASDWAFDVLGEEGIAVDASVFPIWIPGRGDSRAPRLPYEVRPGLLEWPMTSLPLHLGAWALGSWPFSGGSYMRLLPGWAFAWATSRIEARGEPVVIYVHPYEFDGEHPKPRLRERMRPRFWRLESAAPKVEWALARAQHGALEDAADAWWAERRPALPRAAAGGR